MSSHNTKRVKKLDKMQWLATRVVPELKDVSHEDKLEEMYLMVLEEGRERYLISIDNSHGETA